MNSNQPESTPADQITDVSIEMYNLCVKDRTVLKKKVFEHDKQKCLDAIVKIKEALKPDQSGCCSLAANQIGIDARACVVASASGKVYEFTNPEIIEWSNPAHNQEKCYCLQPHDSFIVRRYNSITVKDDSGMTKLTGIDAFAAAHAVGHLNGKMIDEGGISTNEFMKRMLKKIKIPANADCTCGSGRQYKRCCGKSKKRGQHAAL